MMGKPNGISVVTRRMVVGGTLVAALGVGTWALASNRDDRKGASQEHPREMPGIEGPGGMEMSGMGMGSDGSVRLTADQIRQFGITFGTVERRTLEDAVRTVGIVSFDETRIASVALKFGGFIERMYVDFTGKPVRKGQPLVEVYSPELVAAQEELILAANLDEKLGDSAVPGVPAGASDLIGAARRRLRLWDISEGQINEILRTGRSRRTLTLYAPVSGVVVEKSVLQGQAVQAGQPLYTIADLTEVWIEAEIREADAGLVQEGSSATVELTAFPGRPVVGRVEYVYPTLQSEARSLKARIAISNPERRIKPGMYATVRLTAPVRTALAVPNSAVMRTGERQVVFVDMGGGELMPHEVEIGRVAGDYAEVLAGLEPGQRVVTSAQFLLDSESNLAEVMKGMMTQMNMSDMGSMEGTDMSGMEGMDMQGADMRGMKMPARQR